MRSAARPWPCLRKRAWSEIEQGLEAATAAVVRGRGARDGDRPGHVARSASEAMAITRTSARRRSHAQQCRSRRGRSASPLSSGAIKEGPVVRRLRRALAKRDISVRRSSTRCSARCARGSKPNARPAGSNRGDQGGLPHARARRGLMGMLAPAFPRPGGRKPGGVPRGHGRSRTAGRGQGIAARGRGAIAVERHGGGACAGSARLRDTAMARSAAGDDAGGRRMDPLSSRGAPDRGIRDRAAFRHRGRSGACVALRAGLRSAPANIRTARPRSSCRWIVSRVGRASRSPARALPTSGRSRPRRCRLISMTGSSPTAHCFRAVSI